MRKIVFALCLLVSGFGLAAQLPTPVVTPGVPLDKILVIVNDSVITQSQVDAAMDTAKMQLRQSNTPVPDEKTLRSQVINNLIYVELQKQMVKRSGIQVSDSELNAAIADIAKHNNLSMENLRESVIKSGMSYDSYRQQIRQQIEFSRLQQQEIGQNITVSDQEVQEFMQKYKNVKGANAEYHIGDILVPITGTPSPLSINKAREKAEQIYQQLIKGADFKKIAAAQSAGDEAFKGGDMGWRKLAELPTIFAAEIDRMDSGAVSKPIQAPNGFHILKVFAIRGSDEKLSADQVQNLLYQRKFAEQLEIWLKGIRDQAYVKFQ